jgi:hypothetical protein
MPYLVSPSHINGEKISLSPNKFTKSIARPPLLEFLNAVPPFLRMKNYFKCMHNSIGQNYVGSKLGYNI